jgi:hypothetical protein
MLEMRCAFEGKAASLLRERGCDTQGKHDKNPNHSPHELS